MQRRRVTLLLLLLQWRWHSARRQAVPGNQLVHILPPPHVCDALTSLTVSVTAGPRVNCSITVKPTLHTLRLETRAARRACECICRFPLHRHTAPYPDPSSAYFAFSIFTASIHSHTSTSDPSGAIFWPLFRKTLRHSRSSDSSARDDAACPRPPVRAGGGRAL